MTAADRGRFAVALATLAEVFGEALSSARLESYFQALADLDIDAVEAAAQICMRTRKFFPKPAELREALDGSPEDQAEVAWMRFLGAVREIGGYESVNFGDPVTHAVVMDLWGDWPTACLLDEKETPFRHQDFVKLYRIRAKQGADQRVEHLPGFTEVDNRRRGFLTHIPPVRRIGDGSSDRVPALASGQR